MVFGKEQGRKEPAAAGEGAFAKMADDMRLEAEEADFETSKGVKVVNTFDGLKLRDDLLRGVYAYGPAPPRRLTSLTKPCHETRCTFWHVVVGTAVAAAVRG